MKKIIDLGKIGITLAGEYNDKTIYEKLTIVLYKGKSYISTKTVQGISPTQDIRSWQLVAEAKDAYHMLVDAEKTTLTEEEFLEQLVDATKGRYILQGNIINAADEEDLTVEHSDLLGIDTLKLANRDNTNGMGYVILRKNKSFAEQVTKENTIYEIRYKFDLNGADITIPEGSVLKFEGGSLINVGHLYLKKTSQIIGNGATITSSTPNFFYVGYGSKLYNLNIKYLGDLVNDDSIIIINQEYIEQSREQSNHFDIIFNNVKVHIPFEHRNKSEENVSAGTAFSIVGLSTQSSSGMYNIKFIDCLVDGWINKAFNIDVKGSWINQVIFDRCHIERARIGFYLRGSQLVHLQRVNLFNCTMQATDLSYYFADCDFFDKSCLYGIETWDWHVTKYKPFKFTSDCFGIVIDAVTACATYDYINRTSAPNMMFNPDIKINNTNGYTKLLGHYNSTGEFISDYLYVIPGNSTFTINQLCSLPDGNYVLTQDARVGNLLGVFSNLGGFLTVEHTHKSLAREGLKPDSMLTKLTYITNDTRKRSQIKMFFLYSFLTVDREINSTDWIDTVLINEFDNVSDINYETLSPSRFSFIKNDFSLVIGDKSNYVKFPSYETMKKGKFNLQLLEGHTKYTTEQILGLESGCYEIIADGSIGLKLGGLRTNLGGLLFVNHHAFGAMLIYIENSTSNAHQIAYGTISKSSLEKELDKTFWVTTPSGIIHPLGEELQTIIPDFIQFEHKEENRGLYFSSNGKRYKLQEQTISEDGSRPKIYSSAVGLFNLDITTNKPYWHIGSQNWIEADGEVANVARFGDSTNKPKNIKIGFQYFDTTLGKPIYWNGSKWVDATGTEV